MIVSPAPTDEELPVGYQTTEPGPLPTTWQIVRLGDVIEHVQNGLTRQQEREPVGLPVTRIETIAGETINPARVRYVAAVTASDREKYLLKSGDILFSHINSEPHIGKCALYVGNPSELLHGMNLLMLRVKPELCDPQYLIYLFRRLRSRGVFAGLAARAVGQASINQGKLRALEIPLPPLSEQRAIAHVLSTVQGAREATEAVIAATRGLKKSLMRHLFTYGPVPVDQVEQVRLKETEIGPVPEYWEVAPLAVAVRESQYGLSVRGESAGTVPILRMNGLADGRVSARDLQFVNLPQAEIAKYKLRAGDVLFNRTNSFDLVGKTALFDLPGEYVFASYLVRITTDAGKLAPAFLNCYLNWEAAQHRLKTLASRGVSQANISASKLKTFALPFPPVGEQHQVVRVLQAVDQKLAMEEGRRQALVVLLGSLLHFLTAGRLRVAPTVSEAPI